MSNHFEGLGKAWLTLLDNPEKQLPQVIGRTLAEGGTRDCWQCKDAKQETLVMAWPGQSSFRIGVTLHGKAGSELRPVTSYPLLEGLPNDMTVEDTYAWKNGTEGSIAAYRNEGTTPLWFYSPFLFRDKEALTPGVRHTFLVAGLAYGLRKALLDELTITEGEQYESFAKEWLAVHPECSRLDVPQLKVPLSGARILQEDLTTDEYQLRVPVTSVEECVVGPEKIYTLIVEFGLTTPNPFRFPLYAPERICKGYIPHAGDEIDALVWLQGRIAD